jgi:hypothetical protein
MKKVSFAVAAATIIVLGATPVFAAEQTLVAEATQAQASATAPAAAPAEAVKPARGQMVYDAEGKRLARVQGFQGNEAVMIFMESKVLYIPTSTLSLKDGKLTTSKTKGDLAGRS